MIVMTIDALKVSLSSYLQTLSSLRDEVARLVGTNKRRGNIVQTLKEANITRLTSDTSGKMKDNTNKNKFVIKL